jgi:predicted MFS family arabinose efflux permease
MPDSPPGPTVPATARKALGRSFMVHPWRPTAATFFANGATFGVWATQIPLLKERLGLDATLLGILLLVLGGGAVTSMMASGYLIRRFGSANLVRFSAVLFIVLLPVTTIVPDVTLLAVVLFLFGAGGGSMDVSMNAHAAEIERSVAKPYMSSFHGMWSLGGLAGAGLGSLLLGVVPGTVQTILAALVLGAIIAISQRHLLEQVELPEGHVHATLRPDLISILIGILAGLTFASEGAVLDWSSIYMKAELGSPTQTAGLGFAAFSAAMAIGRFLGDWIRSHYGATLIVRGGAILAMTGLLLGPLTGLAPLAVLGFALTGLGLSNIVPVLISAAGMTRNPDISIATVTTMGYGGLLAAPPLLGFVADATSYGATFILVAAMGLVIAVGADVARKANIHRP